jgi:YVTN family beta-propeller protein
VVQTISIGGRPIALAAGAGAVWVADAGGDAVVPLDPRSGVPRRPVRLADSPGGVAAGFGALWVTEPLAHKLVRIDPVSGQILAEIGVGAGARAVAAGGGAVWVVNALDGTLSRVDPASNAVASTVPIGDAPGAVAAGAGGVWVTDEGAGALVSVDPRTGTVRRRYAIGAAPAAVALLGQTPWVAAGAPAGREHRGGTLRVEYTAIRVLDPAYPLDVHPAIWRATGDGLVALTQASGAAQLVPDLATTVPQPTDGGRTYAFRLRPGIHYSTGVPVRAADLRRELERLYATHSQAALYYSALQGAAACGKRPAACDLSRGVITDDRAGTIILRLTRPDPDLLFKLTLPTARPVPPGTPRTDLATRPVPSTGPYRVGQFIPGRRLLLVRNERFREWSRAAQPDGYPDRIDIQMNDDPSLRAAAVLRGDADLALEIASVNLTPLRTLYASQLRLHPQPNTSFLSFNVRRAPFDNVLARRAVNLAIDRAAVARRLSGPGLSAPTCQVLPPTSPGTRPTAPGRADPMTGAGTGQTSRAPGRWSAPREPPERPSTSSGPATIPSAPLRPARSPQPCAASATGHTCSAATPSSIGAWPTRTGNGTSATATGPPTTPPQAASSSTSSCPARTTTPRIRPAPPTAADSATHDSTTSSGKPRPCSSPTPRPHKTSGPGPTASPSTRPPGCRW